MSLCSEVVVSSPSGFGRQARWRTQHVLQSEGGAMQWSLVSTRHSRIARRHQYSLRSSTALLRSGIGSMSGSSSSRISATSSSGVNVDVEAGEVMWSPSRERIESSRMSAFVRLASERSGRDLGSWPELHRWSVSEVGPFWQAVSDFCGIKWLHRGDAEAYMPPPLGRNGKVGMRGARWFDGAKLNFAHNLLPPRTEEQVLTSVSESPNLPPRRLTGDALHLLVARCVRALRAAGVGKGDRVSGVMTNSQEAIVCMLGVTAVGAVWSSCSPDFGIGGVVDRLGQISPKLVFFSLGYLYGGRWHDCRGLALVVLAQLPGSPKGVGVPYWPADGSTEGPHGVGLDPDPLSSTDLPPPLIPFSIFLGGGIRTGTDNKHSSSGVRGGSEAARGQEVDDEGAIKFEPTRFDHPVFIMFSSGTTGLPKCMVHGAGGTLLQQKKELELHCDLKRGDRLMFFSTLGWMMWNWAAAALSVDGAALVAFDGSPGHPDLAALWRIAAREGVTHLGASPKYFGTCRQRGVVPSVDCARDGGLHQLRTVLSTGSPLLPEHFQWIYQAVKRDVHLASISGGTDILGCFALGNPTLPVRAGHLQCLGLGMDVCAYRQNAADVTSTSSQEMSDEGKVEGTERSVPSSRVAETGEMGELVCRTPFPSMPVFFWGDTDGSKYRSAYFEAFRGEEVWAHGDHVEITDEGGVVISGRSDAVLNPGGVRIGTAEIYRQVEKVPEVEDSVAVGLRVDGDVQVVLFVKLASATLEDGVHRPSSRGGREEVDGGIFSVYAEVEKKIKMTIRSNLTARHMPSRILTVGDIPYTRSGKKVEVAVTKAIHGEAINNLSALANPDSIEQFQEAGRLLRGLKSAPRSPHPSRL